MSKIVKAYYVKGCKIDSKTIFSGYVFNIDNEDITILSKNFKDVSLAYSMTIHKSQGSEYSTVIVVLPENPAGMLKRNLFYTAITRAKKEVFVVAKQSTLEKAILTVDENSRQTMLKEKLLGYIPNFVVQKFS